LALNEPSTEAESKDPRVEAALREYLERVDRGEPIEVEDFLARHAEIAGPLRSFLVAEDHVRKLAAAETPAKGPEDSTRSLMLHGQETMLPQSMAQRTVASTGARLSGQFGRYRIIKALGQGAMGTVYLAEDTQLQRQVALKTPHFKDDPSRETLERFYREARAAAMLRSAHICPVFDVGEIDGTHYITMAYIAGRPLSAFIQPDKLQTERQIVIVIRKLALALQEAHDYGIVHRDLKPANIMVDKKGEPIITDFGLARQVRDKEDIRLTQDGVMIGTPAFMSPEQVDGDSEKIGTPTDQYSLGIVFYELLTGQLPFRGSMLAVMGQILVAEVVPPSRLRPDLDPRIEAVCLKMMAKNPADRFASMSAVANELETILRVPSTAAAIDEKPAPSAPGDPAIRTTNTKIRASQNATSVTKKTSVGSGPPSSEELARKYLARHDYERAADVIERVPADCRSPSFQALLKQAHERADEVALLICELDDAVRHGNEATAIQHAERLLKLKPGHYRAQHIGQEFATRGKTDRARISPFPQLNRLWHEAGWIRASVLALALAILGVMLGVVIIYARPGKSVLKIEIHDPNVEVAVKGSMVLLRAPGQEIEIQPGETELTITRGDLQFTTARFSLKRGDERTVTVGLVDSKLAAISGNEILGERPLELPPQKVSGAEMKRTVAKSNSPASLIAPFDSTEARAARTAWARASQIEEEQANSLEMKFVLIPPGIFHMGAPSSREEPSSNDDERPLHRVQITQPFYLSVHEVTQQEFQRVTGHDPSLFQRSAEVANSDTRRFPVETVSWFDAVDFCNQLSQLENRQAYYAISGIERNDDGSIRAASVTVAGGNGYRLPTEAQWEYACRAGTTTPFHFGTTNNAHEANVDGENPYGTEERGPLVRRPIEVGSYPANAFSLDDMHGNVWEWCQDWYDATYYGRSPASDPQGPETGERRVERGGCYVSHAEFSRSAARSNDRPDVRAGGTGFRIALDVDAVKTGGGHADARDHSSPTAATNDAGVTGKAGSDRGALVIRGDWQIRGQELVKFGKRVGGSEIYFGDPNWKDYDFSAEIYREQGDRMCCLNYRCADQANKCVFIIAGWRNNSSGAQVWNKGVEVTIRKRPCRLVNNRWYTALVKVRGNRSEGYLDGERLFENQDDQHPNGRAGLGTNQGVYRFRNIKITAPDGTVLWQGLPDLPSKAAAMQQSSAVDPLERRGRRNGGFSLFCAVAAGLA
jgi:formylglycine-generating enzyme required for sulfatase activity/serine/threonine protein kinase